MADELAAIRERAKAVGGLVVLDPSDFPMAQDFLDAVDDRNYLLWLVDNLQARLANDQRALHASIETNGKHGAEITRLTKLCEEYKDGWSLTQMRAGLVVPRVPGPPIDFGELDVARSGDVRIDGQSAGQEEARLDQAGPSSQVAGYAAGVARSELGAGAGGVDAGEAPAGQAGSAGSAG